MHLFNVYVAVNKDEKKEAEQGLSPPPTKVQAKKVFQLLENGTRPTTQVMPA